MQKFIPVTEEGEDEPMVIVNPMVGSDPEVFVYSLDQHCIHPVLDLVGGTKESPRPLGREGYFVQEDNVLAEFNIPPAKTRKEFIENIQTGYELLKTELKSKGFIPLVTASHKFKPDQLQDPRAMVFGCTPDYNAWLGLEVENPSPSPEKEPLLRSAGGHWLLGYDNPRKETNVAMVKLADALLGLPAVLLDGDTDRRKLYGKAGSFRHKAFGVEYRTLSSFWIKNAVWTGWVWDQIMRAVDMVNAGDFSILDFEPYIIDTINRADAKQAKKFVSEFNIQMPY